MDGILFDKDGTLFSLRDSWYGWALAVLDALTEAGGKRAEIAHVLGLDEAGGGFLPDSLVVSAPAGQTISALAAILPQMSEQEVGDIMRGLAAQAQMVPVLPLADYLGRLKARGLRLGVATNDSEAAARRHLGAFGLLDYFDFIAGYDSGFGPKPEPGMCLAFAEAIAAKPEAVAMVGDSRHDLGAGRAAGLVTIGVLTGVARAQDLADLADVILDDIGEIDAWLDARETVL